MLDQCARCQVEVGVHDQPQSQSPEKARPCSMAGLTPTPALSFRNLGLAGARSQQTDSLHAIQWL